jgi:predicted dehydrogenase
LEAVSYGGVADPRAISFVYHQMQLTDIIQSIEAGKPPRIGGEDGLRAVQLIESIYQSSATDRPAIIVEGFD